MKKGTRRIIIVLAAALAMIFTAMPVSATTHITGVNISQTSVSLTTGHSKGLQYRYQYVGGEAPTKTYVKSHTHWKSSNTRVATVKDGVITAKTAGTVTIEAEMDGNKDTCKVTVKKSPAKFVNANQCYTYLNKYRKNKAHAKALKKDAQLVKIAKIRAKEIAIKHKFSHTRPNGKSGLTLIKGNKYKGENIAKGQSTCYQVSVDWYNSKGHRHNMLNKKFKKVGIAGYEYDGVIYWVQVFSS